MMNNLQAEANVNRDGGEAAGLLQRHLHVGRSEQPVAIGWLCGLMAKPDGIIRHNHRVKTANLRPRCAGPGGYWNRYLTVVDPW